MMELDTRMRARVADVFTHTVFEVKLMAEKP
jgi:hypothetical protein